MLVETPPQVVTIKIISSHCYHPQCGQLIYVNLFTLPVRKLIFKELSLIVQFNSSPKDKTGLRVLPFLI